MRQHIICPNCGKKLSNAYVDVNTERVNPLNSESLVTINTPSMRLVLYVPEFVPDIQKK